MKSMRSAMFSLLPILLCPACATPGGSGHLLQAVAWVQTAAERDALCEQVFAAATAAMRAATAEVGERPYAVVVDVDETMLDNSPYQAALVRDGRSFDADSWNAWCRDAHAAAVPGAVAFADACRARSVAVFYVTNRDRALEGATRLNLAGCGLPVDDIGGIDVVLCRGEVDGEGDKAGRRARVEETHDVVVWVGDDLGDFATPKESVAQRRLQVQRHLDDWGARWFVLPNPMYGSWDRALTRAAGAPDAARRAALSPAR
ncbi:MAG: 5'-nucleotidase, lipoprotein e(P4) family [Planctomycetota bacterium]